MKQFDALQIRYDLGRQQALELRDLLATRKRLKERQELLPFLRQQRFRFLVRDEIETDEQSFSAHVGDRAALFRQRFEPFAQQSPDFR